MALGGRADGNHDPVEVGHVPAVDAEAFDFEHPALPQSAAWRVTRPGKSPQQRPLTVTLAALSVVAALGEPHIDTLLNRLGLTAEHLLFKHLTGIVAAGSVLDFVANMADRGTDPHSRRICYGPGGLTGTIMIAVSPFIPRGPSGRGFELTNTDQTSVFLYWVFWLGYLGTAVVLATRLCCEQVRAASPGRLRLGLGIIGTGAAIGCGYILNKATFVALGYLPWLRLPLSGPRTEMINDFLLYTSLFLSVVGTTVPTQLASCMASPILRLQEQRDLELLRPLWPALTRSRPDVVLREVPKGNTRLQRYRCVIEIDDAALTLQEYRQPEIEKAARAAGRNAGLTSMFRDEPSVAPVGGSG
ncbi:MAB_1171c family putative transporter [Streptomyces mirabilis]